MELFDKEKKEYTECKFDEIKIKILIDGDSLSKHSYPYLGYKRLINNAIGIAKRNKWFYQEARLRAFLGGFEAGKGHLDKAEKSYLLAIEISKKRLTNSDTAFFEGALTYLWNIQGFYQKVIKKNLEIIKSETLVSNPVFFMHCINRVASSYKALKDFENAIKYGKQSIDFALINKLENTALVNAYSNLAGAYNGMKQNEQAKKCYLKAKQLAKKLDAQVHIGFIYTNLSNIYAAMNDFPKSYEYSAKAIYIGQVYNNDKILSNAYLNIAQTKYGEDKYIDCIENLKFSLKYLKKTKEQFVLRNVYLYFQKAYTKLNDFKSALIFYRKFIDVETQLRDKDARIKLKGFEIKYEAAKKEKQILQLTAENQANVLKMNEVLQLHESENRNQANRIEQQLREELAHKLHNNVASTLVSTKMYLEELARSGRLSSDEKKYATKALTQLNATYKDMRQLAQEIKEIDHRDLKKELSQLIALYSSLPNLTFKSQVNIATPVEGDFVIDTLGIIKELMTNALKHSMANQFILKVDVNSKRLSLVFKFNGEKFDGKNANKQSSGYQSIRNYLLKYNGAIKHATNSLFSIIDIKISIREVKQLG